MAVDGAHVRYDIDQLENTGAREPADQILALRASIGIDDDDGNVADVGGGRISQHGELNHRRDEDDAEDARVLAQLDHLFPHHVKNSPED